MFELQSHASENEDGRLHLDVAEHFFSKKKMQCDTPYGQKADSQDHFHGSDFVI